MKVSPKTARVRVSIEFEDEYGEVSRCETEHSGADLLSFDFEIEPSIKREMTRDGLHHALDEDGRFELRLNLIARNESRGDD